VKLKELQFSQLVGERDMDWTKLADDNAVKKTAKSLRERGIEVMVVSKCEEAGEKVVELIPEGVEVMNQTSVTLDEIGVSKEIQESGRYQSVRNKTVSISDREEKLAFRRKAAAVEYTVGSVHAVTEGGQVVIASQSGSQLSPYAYSATNVIWVVGTQKNPQESG